MPSSEELMRVIKVQTEIAKLGLDLGAVMQYVVEQTLNLISADGAAIELAEGEDMVYRAAAGISSENLGLRLKMSASLSGLCVTSGNVQLCSDSEADQRVDRSACRQIGLRSMIVLPLKYMDTTVGVLKAMSLMPNNFSDKETDLLNILTDMIAAAMFFAAKYDKDALYYKATHDCMTGLANKALFMDRLRHTINQSNTEHHQSAIVIADMDGLKQVNDNYGHRAGDEAIKEFAYRLKLIIRRSDTAARIGGDEFGLILTPIENHEALEIIIQRLKSKLTYPLEFENNQFKLMASVGSALIPHDGREINNLIDTADQRMYSVKKYRKNKRRV
ncbi:sensor domain-containing diguanylate cyclase [Thalassotalea sediminis]|uniref:sensor domain-containing diguanylate cyclase n=1 Tax=Thalassotalea sediminis TaxID=1759089 RepID=UPI0025733391|nr:sensor domain-containing diguanylate cyclase [Thalassotalea sediminis]